MPNNQIHNNLSKLPQILKEVKNITMASLNALLWLCIASCAFTAAFGVFKALYLVIKYILVFKF